LPGSAEWGQNAKRRFWLIFALLASAQQRFSHPSSQLFEPAQPQDTLQLKAEVARLNADSFNRENSYTAQNRLVRP